LGPRGPQHQPNRLMQFFASRAAFCGGNLPTRLFDEA
jgi:hypothetical protein